MILSISQHHLHWDHLGPGHHRHLLPGLPASLPAPEHHCPPSSQRIFIIESGHIHSPVPDPPMMPFTLRNKPKLLARALQKLASPPCPSSHCTFWPICFPRSNYTAKSFAISWSLHMLFLLMQKLSSQFHAWPTNSFSTTDFSSIVTSSKRSSQPEIIPHSPSKLTLSKHQCTFPSPYYNPQLGCLFICAFIYCLSSPLESKLQKVTDVEVFLVIKSLRLSSQCRGTDLIPGQEAKILHATWCGQNKQKIKNNNQKGHRFLSYSPLCPWKFPQCQVRWSSQPQGLCTNHPSA